MIADFNRDGWRDILFTCHSYEGNHRNDSFLYWGGAGGYSPDRRALLPGIGPHLMTVSDIGNIYTRSDRYDYTSTAFNAGERASFERLTWQGEAPFRTGLEFQVRRALRREELKTARWQGPEGYGSVFKKSEASLRGLEGQGGWIQYKATLVSPDSANTPILRSVNVEYR